VGLAVSEFLLVDISNSFTKLAPASAEAVGRPRRIPTSELGVKALHRFNAPTVVLSSVVPEKERFILRHFRNRRVIRVDHRVRLGIGIDYPRPGSIGADRLANAAAAAALYGAPCVVVDFGTAVTFDILSPGGDYVGGVIAPGLAAMTDYLYQRTALLPRITLSEPAGAIGKTTRSAMLAGAVIGYRGMVREILREIRRDLGGRRAPKVVATGGYAELIASRLDAVDAVHPTLTLEGLRIIGALNR
jgi:type III pantothenate kinase